MSEVPLRMRPSTGWPTCDVIDSVKGQHSGHFYETSWMRELPTFMRIPRPARRSLMLGGVGSPREEKC